MKHVFLATLIGWDGKKEIVWFDSSEYTKETAEAEFKPYTDITMRGYPYIGYEYGGKKYHDYTYWGEFEDDRMPKSIDDLCYHQL